MLRVFATAVVSIGILVVTPAPAGAADGASTKKQSRQELKIAAKLLNAKQLDKGIQKLGKVIADYPKTSAAKS